jgi:hypothetical protein
MTDLIDQLSAITAKLKKYELTNITPVGDFVWQMDHYGNFRIGHVPSDIYGEWVPYQSIARMQYNGDLYIGVSAYYGGVIPHETVLKVEQMG